METEFYLKMAAMMLECQVNKLDPSLVNELCFVDGLCRKADGRLFAKDAIATIVNNWLKNNASLDKTERQGYTRL